MTFEYKVIPSPTRGQKGKGVKGPEGRFAHALESQMNLLAGNGWEFVRAETLPNEERSGLTGSNTTYRSVLVFRRAKAGDVAAFQPESLAPPKTAELPAPQADNTPSDDETLVLEENDKTGASAVKDPDEGDTLQDVPDVLKKRVETLERP
ncbi:DUF4177 domain-containing protein [Shimia sp. NS0008-38b]|uniref:DUF4177 domain-containing protein n=1 Tax=Shimia sp. NS0008-38b TaxID=3127653 RepID=UPI0031074027